MLFSVIVPIYNVEKYIRRCIESVLCQTFTDFELILVDDGSPDNCPAICDEYAKKDNRIRVIHKENGGLVSARQAGIRLATGTYVFNLDGDDALCDHALQSAYAIIRDTHADIVSFSYKICANDLVGETVDDLVPEGLYDKTQMREQIYPKLLSDTHMQHVFYFLWGRAIKRELILPHQLRVNPAIAQGEDVSCIVPCFLEAETVYMSREAVYLYTVRNDSLTTKLKPQQITQIHDTIVGLRDLPVEKPDDFEAQIARYSCFMCLAILALAAEGNGFSSLKTMKQLILQSVHKTEIKKAHFELVTAKSRVTIALMKKGRIGIAFYFLYVCKLLKRMGRGKQRG